MMATFVIELGLAAYVLYRYRKTVIGRLVVALLICLSIFQLAEYFVCNNAGYEVIASRIGYVAITFLPVLGLHLMSLMTSPLSKKLIKYMYGMTVAFAAYFLLAPGVFQSNVCTGNYVIFQLSNAEIGAYSLFYFGFITAAVRSGLQYLKKPLKSKNVSAVRWLLVGYALFILPTAAVVVFHPDTRRALPSVLCGFAIALAVILAVKITPLTSKKDK